jgi:hypothetical protein
MDFDARRPAIFGARYPRKPTEIQGTAATAASPMASDSK